MLCSFTGKLEGYENVAQQYLIICSFVEVIQNTQ